MADVLPSSSSPQAVLQQQHHQQAHHHHHLQQRRHVSSSYEDCAEEEELDPRIQVELETLNRATEEINRLELELDDARASFRQVLSDSTQRLNGLAKKLGASVDKARPYYDARMKLKEAHIESQKAALRFERACSMHEAAKEMVQLAEEGYKRREEDLDPTWQEMLNHATMKVNDAESERIESEKNHQSTTANFKKREEEVHKLQRDLKRAITKSKPYFEMKAKFNQVMEDHKRSVSRLEEDVLSTKALYSDALRSLEAISDEIHRHRLERRQKMHLGIRGSGVGAESPSPPPSWEKGANIEGSASCSLVADDDGFSNESNGRKRCKDQGIVGCDYPLCRQTSVSDHHYDPSSLSSDPLNVVVFTNESQTQLHHHPPPHHHRHYHHHHCRSNQSPCAGSSASCDFHLPSVIHSDPCSTRTHSYRQAVEYHEGDGLYEEGDSNIDHNNKHSPLPNPISNHHHHSVDEAMQSSLSRAQEWVNKSPVPTQRRFVKSQSLINASASSPTSSASSLSSQPHQQVIIAASDSVRTHQGFSKSNETVHPPITNQVQALMTNIAPTSPSKTASALSARLVSESHSLPDNQTNTLLDQHPTTPETSSTVSNNYILQQKSSSKSHSISSSSISPSLTTSHLTDDPSHAIEIQPHLQSSPNSRYQRQHSSPSPTTTSSGKSPKLQGIILKIDAASIVDPVALSLGRISKSMASVTTTTTTTAAYPSSTPSSNLNNQTISIKKTKVDDSSLPNNQNSNEIGNLKNQQSNSIIYPSASNAQQSISQTSLPHQKSPPTSLIPSTNKPTSSSSILSTSKLLPLVASLVKPNPPTSTSYHLPSPTQPSSNISLVPPGALMRQQVTVSPTPLSPCGDRVSILSGRSGDSGRPGSHLCPPSDSSDTESIASTGPMLDDEQVELLTLDFSESSITPAMPYQEEMEGDVDVPGLNRGNWSRMSLPPRLGQLISGGGVSRMASDPSGCNFDSGEALNDAGMVCDNGEGSEIEVMGQIYRIDGDEVGVTEDVVVDYVENDDEETFDENDVTVTVILRDDDKNGIVVSSDGEGIDLIPDDDGVENNAGDNNEIQFVQGSSLETCDDIDDESGCKNDGADDVNENDDECEA